MLDARPAAAADALPQQHGAAGRREGDGDEEEEEAGGEGGIGGDADAAEEADEERLAHGEAVERERHEQDEEEERSHHVVDPRTELDADRPRRSPDREHANCLDDGGEREQADQQPSVPPEVVHSLVERAERALDAESPEKWRRAGNPGARSTGEKEDR